MMTFRVTLVGCAVAARAILHPRLYAQRGLNVPPGPPVQVTVNGRTWTQQELFQRNVGGQGDQITPFPPHKIIGNIYYVGTTSLSSFLVVTPQGHVLIDSTYERNIPTIQKSVEQLGFKFADIKILMAAKYAKLASGGPNPYIDPAGYKAELDLDEAMFHAVLAAQQKAASQAN